MAKISSSKDVLMLLLYAKGQRGEQCEPIRGRTRLMKMVFLFDKEVRRKFNLEQQIPESVIPKFKPFDFGPFSADVFSDLEFLVELEFVKVSMLENAEVVPEEAQEYDYWQAGTDPGDGSGPESEEEFSLTNVGREFVEEQIAPALTPEQWDVLEKFKARCTGTELRSLLHYVYSRYPDMITKSKIREAILGQG